MFITDTHSIGHFAAHKHSRLSRRSLQLFENAERGEVLIHVSTASLWEITGLIRLGRIKLPSRFDDWCKSLNAMRGFALEPLLWTDVNEARNLPFKDPFDSLIVGTAIRLGYPLITRDQAIVDSGLVETVW